MKSFDYQILGEHAAVMDRVSESAEQSVHQRDYFPRRPMLLPKLLQALNDTESTRRTLVNLIVADPALAGSVLQRANNAFYRTSREPVDSLDRAVQTLGIDGLRGLIAVAILQPVFRLPRGYFDNFADVTWEQAQRCATAAETHASVTRTADPFIAQLLGLLGSLARIVLFRLTVDMYREHPNVLPRAEVFIRSMQVHAPDRRLPSRAVVGAVRPRDERAARAGRPGPAGADGSAGPRDVFRRAGRQGDAARARAMRSRGSAAEALLIEQGLPTPDRPRRVERRGGTGQRR